MFVLFIFAAGWLAYGPTKEITFATFGLMAFKEVAWGLWALMIPMLYYESIAHGGDEEWAEILGLLTFPFAFAAMSIAVSVIPEQKRTTARFAAAIVAVFFLSFAAHRPALVSQVSVAMLGLSIERQPVTLVLSESGCNSVNLLLDGSPCTFNTAAKLGSLLNARIVSRIGAQFVIHWRPLTSQITKAKPSGTADTDENWRRAILKKEDVISWAYDFGGKKKRQ